VPGYAAAVAALAAMPLVIYTVAASLDPAVAPVVFAAPSGHAGWDGPVSGVGDAWNPDFVGPHSQWHLGYRGTAGRSVEMLVIGYSSQAQGRELVSSGNSLFGAARESSVAESKVQLGGESYIETVATDALGHRSVVWSVYDIGGREFATPLMSQLWYGIRSFVGPPYSVLFAFRTACSGSCGAARDTLRSFVQTMGPDCFASVTREPRPVHVSRPA
jgi:EpsI family protein